MTILFATIARAWLYILAAILLGVVAYKANYWCNAVCVDFREKYADAEGRI
jgi:hypothetical protein